MGYLHAYLKTLDILSCVHVSKYEVSLIYILLYYYNPLYREAVIKLQKTCHTINYMRVSDQVKKIYLL